MDLDFLKTYMRIDGNEDDLYLQSLIEISEIYIDSMVGENYKVDIKLLKLSSLLQQKLISDMYESRGTQIPGGTKTDRIVESILMKLSIADEVVIV